jgi:hypothetical protein
MTHLESLPTYDTLPETQPAPAPRAGQLLALWVGVLALLAGGVFGAVYLSGQDEGTPEEAVRRMFDAVAKTDVLGVLETLAPSERAALRENLPAMAVELKRLGIAAEDFSLNKIKGVDLKFSGLQLSSRTVGEGVTAVSIDGGTFTYRVAPRDLPLGSFVKDIIGKDLPTEPQTGSDDAKSSQPTDNTVVTVKEGGRWYVSLYYSAAEAARSGSGKPAPNFGHGLSARGEDSPEHAVDALLRAGAALDVQRLIELLPPDEGRVLRDYAPLFLDDTKRAAADSGFKGAVTGLQLSSVRNGSHAVVTPKAFKLDFAASGTRGSVAFDGRCITMAGPDLAPGAGRICPEDAKGPQALTGLMSRLPTQGSIVAVEQGGQWYVSPTRTVLESVVGVLRALQRSDLDALRDFVNQTTSFQTGSAQIGSLTPG